MAQTASQRIAAELAARKNKEAAAAPAEADTDQGDSDEAGEDSAAEAEAPKKPMTLREKQAAKKAAANNIVPAIAAEVSDDSDDVGPTSGEEDSVDSSPKPTSRAASKGSSAPKSTSTSAKAKSSGSTSSAKSSPGKKQPSPAQLAAREKFAEASRARSAAKAAGTSPSAVPASKASTAKPSSKTTSGPKATTAKAVVSSKPGAKGKVSPVKTSGPQTPEQIKAKQNADRQARRDAAAQTEAERPRRQSTSKPKVVQKPSAKAAAAVAKRDAGKVTKPAGETKTKVHALLDKGKTRQEIMAALDLSYASVLHHARSYEGEVSSVKGKIFVKTLLDEEGKKIGKGKSEEVSRSEAMRREFKSGTEVGDVARKFEVRYQIAYTAIRPLILAQEEE